MRHRRHCQSLIGLFGISSPSRASIAPCASQRGQKLIAGRRTEHLHARHADGVIVDVARLARHHHFVLQPVQLRQALHFLGIGAGDAGGCGMGQRRSATGGDDAPFRLRNLRQPPSDAIHQLVHLDVVPRSLIHRLLHFRQGLRPADDGERPLAVYHRLHADPLVDVAFGQRRGQNGYLLSQPARTPRPAFPNSCRRLAINVSLIAIPRLLS